MKRGWFILILGINILNCLAQPQFKEITLDDIYNSKKFNPEGVNEITSMKDGEHYTSLNDYRNIVKSEYKTGNILDTLFSLPKISSVIKYIYDYQFNHDESKILVSTNIEPIYRHSFMAEFYIYDIKAKKLEPLSMKGHQQLASFSPDGIHIAYFSDNNLYIKDIITNSEIQITTDGKKNEIINGAPDWVYEEEFGFSKAYSWSPDGSYLAYMRFDESRVKTYTLTYYDQLYPTQYEYKYPKAGEDNSIVSVHIYNIKTGTTVKADVGTETNQYIPRISWTADPQKLCIIRLNRLQNQVNIIIADANKGSGSVIYSDSNKYYISEINDNYVTFLEDNKHFIVFSERDGYNHLYLYTLNGKLEKLLTKGMFDVSEFLGNNPKKHNIYYSSCEPSPLQKATYSIKLDGTGKQLITKTSGTNNVEFNTTFSYFINTYSNANLPPVVTLCNDTGGVIRKLEDNSGLNSNMKSYQFGKKTFFEFKDKDSISLYGYLIKPANFDSSRKYPLFMYVYGGPESQEVTDAWDPNIAWFQMLTQKGYIVACVDNRGTNSRGEAFRKSTYMQLGKLETEDQIAAARYLSAQSYIDATRIGIFGWSYGGYMSSLCMLKGNDIFKAGIAVAPVTNWRFYDNIYTERFMRTPQENPTGYDNNSPITQTDKLKGKFLLIHGSADDNVHLQNTMEFAEKLIQSKKLFDMMIYPNKNHSIYGGNTRYQLYSKMTDFILTNL